jgi:hypothetical protein
MMIELIDAEIAAGGTPARYPLDQVALLSQSIFDGLGIARLVDPSSVSDDTMDTVLGFLYDSM